MKKIITVLTAAVFASLLLGSAAKGEDATPNLPDSAWELHTGADFATILTAKTDKQPNFLIVYLRNNTSSRVELASFGRDHGFQFFFTDGSGACPNLHSYDPTQDISAHPRTIMTPGEIRPFKIELSPADVALIKSTPIQCSFRITNLTTKQEYNITTSPKTYSLPQ